MDKAAIRDEAQKLGGDIAVELYREVIKQDEWDLFMRVAEAALTAVHDAGWDERGEADAEACLKVGRSSTAQVRNFGYLSRVTSSHIGGFFNDAVKAIRRLRKGKP